MSEDARRPRWALIVLLAGVGLVVVIALIAVFAHGAPAQFAADTPEGVVQRYSQAVVAGDVDTALTYVVPDVAGSCEQTGTSGDIRVTLVKTVEHDTTANVDVQVVTVSGSGPLGTNEYASDEVFRLVKHGDTWLVESAPWQLAVCYGLQ
ncbi:hypothetical protein [Microbacterium deminutum]|uniref:Nuclear transport factor 2 family protein n=1 Tax=Microbacterium deminutum TaxID=344164 RepID=A0ABP5CWI4_9MICO